MTNDKRLWRARLIACHATIAACVPYLFLKVMWLSGSSIGFGSTDMTTAEHIAGNAVTAGMDLVAVLVALAFTYPWGRRVPAWLVLVPIWVGTGLLAPIALGMPVGLTVQALVGGSPIPESAGADAGDPAAMRNLGVLLSQSGRADEANYWYQRAASTESHQPHHVYAQRTQAPAYHRESRPAYGKAPYNSAAVFSLTFGILSLFTCGLTAIPAIVCGHMGWVRHRRNNERGGWMCITGIVLGWLMIGLLALAAWGSTLPDEPTA
ncbi:DUF4190 domain-containing protein [Actinomadura kijaniata]|uniref:DUF4190 domain-containing protein n=1 Tax=Actinomadura kijaniata TaxID=46161 RepID=UPI003F1BF4E7